MDVLPANDRERICSRAEQFGDSFALQPVALILELAQRDELALRILEALEQLDRLVQLTRRAIDDLGLTLRPAGISRTSYASMLSAASSM